MVSYVLVDVAILDGADTMIRVSFQTFTTLGLTYWIPRKELHKDFHIQAWGDRAPGLDNITLAISRSYLSLNNINHEHCQEYTK